MLKKNSKIFVIKSKIIPIDRGIYTILSDQSKSSSNNSSSNNSSNNNSIIDSSNNSNYDDDFAKNNIITADITKYYNSNC